jgi:hypothetical protein
MKAGLNHEPGSTSSRARIHRAAFDEVAVETDNDVDGALGSALSINRAGT